MGFSFKEKIKDIIKFTEIFEEYKPKFNYKDKECITSFSLLRNNRVMLIFKEGKVKIFKLVETN